ncbi:MAG: PHB depolymerase family esterase [Anaerolineae bacterium]
MAGENLVLYHLVHQAKVVSEKPPLLIMLHGVGSNEEDLFGLASYLDPRFLVLSARGPLTLMPGSYAWFRVQWIGNRPHANPEDAEKSRQMLAQFVEQAVQAYRADPRQVYLLGFSQGAIMSGSVMLTRPDLLAGVAALSGRILPEVRPQTVSPERLKGFPVLVQHGLYDQVLPIEYGRDSHAFLTKLPVALTYREYPMAHEISQESLRDLAAWLLKQLDQAPASEAG